MRLQSEVPAVGIHKIKVTKPLTEREWLQKEERTTVHRFKFNVADCFMVRRSERNRARMTQNDGERKKLFFVSREMEEDGASRHSVVIQQILDTAHIWCCHTLRVKADQYIDGKLGDDDDDEKEVDWSCTDRLSQQFGALIERRRARTGSGRH